MKKQPEQMPEDQRFHDTYLLLKKYRDVVWGLELSVQQVKRRFQMEVGSSIKDFWTPSTLPAWIFRITALKNRPEALKKAIKC